MKLKYLALALLAGMAITGCNKNGGTPAPEEPVLREIAITHQPDKTTYYLNETLDLTGLEVTAYYTAGKAAEVVTAYQVFGFDSSVVNPALDVTVKYVDKTATFTVSVEEEVVVLQSIRVTTLPTKTTYYVNESFSQAGMVVTAYYSNGTNRVVSPTGMSVPPFFDPGEKTITIMYNEGDNWKQDSFTVTVLPLPTITVSYVDGLSSGGDLSGIDTENSVMPTSVTANQPFNVSIRVKAGYEYVGWGVPFDYADASFYDQFEQYDFTEADFTITPKTFNLTIYIGVRAEVAKYGVFFEEVDHLTFNLVGSETAFEAGAEVKFTITPATGWEVDGMPTNVGGEALTIQKNLNDEYYFTMPGHAVNITATAKEAAVASTYSVTFDTVEHVTFTKHPAVSMTGLNENDQFMFKVTVEEGWKLQGEPFCSNRSDVYVQNITINPYPYAFSMPAGDVTITANVVADTPAVASHNISYLCLNAQTMEPISNDAIGAASVLPTSAEEGATVNLSVVAAEGFTYLAWGMPYDYDSDFYDQFLDYEGNENAISFTMPKYDIQFKFYFNVPEVAKHTITYSPVSFDDGSAMATALANTSVLPAEVEEGGEVTINVAAASGYIYKGFAFDSTDPKYDQAFWDQFIGYDMTESTITFNMPAYDIEIFLRFVVDGGGEGGEGGEGGDLSVLNGTFLYNTGGNNPIDLKFTFDGAGNGTYSWINAYGVEKNLFAITYTVNGSTATVTVPSSVPTSTITGFNSGYRLVDTYDGNTDWTNTITIINNNSFSISLWKRSAGVSSQNDPFTFARQAA